MFWRRARAKTPKAAGAAPAVATPGTYQEPTRPSYDDAEYWERERLDPWAAARAEAQAWSKRHADVAAARARASAASMAGARGAGACVVEPAGASYAAGFTSDTGLVTPAAFDARVPREARLVLAVGEARVPVAFDAREVVNAVGHGGLFHSEVATCLMGEADLTRARSTARTAREHEIARLLFRPPRVEAVVDPYGAWGLVAARDTLGPDRHGAPTRGPGLAAVALGPRPAGAGARPGGLGAPLQHPPAFSMYDEVAAHDAGYNDMYGDDDDDNDDGGGGQANGDPRL